MGTGQQYIYMVHGRLWPSSVEEWQSLEGGPGACDAISAHVRMMLTGRRQDDLVVDCSTGYKESSLLEERGHVEFGLKDGALSVHGVFGGATDRMGLLGRYHGIASRTASRTFKLAELTGVLHDSAERRDPKMVKVGAVFSAEVALGGDVRKTFLGLVAGLGQAARRAVYHVEALQAWAWSALDPEWLELHRVVEGLPPEGTPEALARLLDLAAGCSLFMRNGRHHEDLRRMLASPGDLDLYEDRPSGPWPRPVEPPHPLTFLRDLRRAAAWSRSDAPVEEAGYRNRTRHGALVVVLHDVARTLYDPGVASRGRYGSMQDACHHVARIVSP